METTRFNSFASYDNIIFWIIQALFYLIEKGRNVFLVVLPRPHDMEEGKLQHYIKLLVKQTKTNTKAITSEIEAVKELKKQTEAKEKEVKVDPEVKKAAELIANDPFHTRLEDDLNSILFFGYPFEITNSCSFWGCR